MNCRFGVRESGKSVVIGIFVSIVLLLSELVSLMLIALLSLLLNASTTASFHVGNTVFVVISFSL